MSDDRTEPRHDPTTEAAVLGALLQSSHAVNEVRDLLSSSDFYITNHQTIYTACLNAAERHDSSDFISVANEIASDGNLDLVGGYEYLTELAQAVASPANVRAHAAIVREHANLRRLAELGARALRDGQTSGNFEEAVNSFKSDVDALSAYNRETDQVQPVGQLSERTIDFLEEVQQSGGGMMGLPSGLTALDRMTKGWQKQNLYVIAARPAMGKSMVALHFAREAAQRGLTVAFFSLEMSAVEVTMRLMSAIGRVDNERMQTGTLNSVDWDTLRDAANRMSDMNLFVDEDPTPTMNDIRRRCERIETLTGSLDLVIIDYLQLVAANSSRNNSSRQEDVAGISRGAKVLAKDLNVPVIALSQLSRKVEERPNKRPMLADLRESGGIEQDATFVGFLYRDEVYNPDTPDQGILEIINKKNRSGRDNQMARVAFIPHLFTIAPLANVDMPEDLPPDNAF